MINDFAPFQPFCTYAILKKMSVKYFWRYEFLFGSLRDPTLQSQMLLFGSKIVSLLMKESTSILPVQHKEVFGLKRMGQNLNESSKTFHISQSCWKDPP